MQREAYGRDYEFDFGDPFLRFGSFGSARRLPSFFTGMDPFNYPIFTNPFFTNPLRSCMGPSIWENSMSHGRSIPIENASRCELVEHQPLQQYRTSEPIIQEISDKEDHDESSKESEADPKKIFNSSNEQCLRNPDEIGGVEEQSKYKNIVESAGQPQANKYTFYNSDVTYGGINGAYYTASTTKKMGPDGVMMEESKEADISARRATHRVSRGINDKGHSLTRRLNSEGKVDQVQTLHNLNEEELPRFEAAWKGSAGNCFLGWEPGMSTHNYGNMRSNSTCRERTSRVIEIEFLPSTKEQIEISQKPGSNSTRGERSSRIIEIEFLPSTKEQIEISHKPGA